MPRRIVQLMSVVLLALWLPTTLHCRLESLGLDALFSCATQPIQTAHADGAECSDDLCQTLESGQFAIAKTKIDPAILPVLACACVSCFLPVAPAAPVPEISAPRQDELLPMQRTWQFARRAALPARAPDVVA